MSSKLKFFFAVIIIFFFSQAFSGELSPPGYQKLDPRLCLLLDHPELKPLVYIQMTGREFIESITKINVLIKTTLSKSALNKFSIKVQGRIGDIVAATMPIDQIPDLVTHPEVSYIQGPRVVSIHNDVSVPEIGALKARQQYNLTGKGVIIGIIDTGIDWRHLDFRNPNGTTRIKALLDLSEPGFDKAGGMLYTEQEINNALNGIGTVNEKDLVGHGTHVAGSAAGNGRATGNGVPANTYIGVAPETDLVIVKANRTEGINFERNDYIPSMEFIDSVATALNKSYIINISSGGNFGPHDGKDLSEQAIDELLTDPKNKCKAIVVSAGNDGNNNVHASGTFGVGKTNIDTEFTVASYTPSPDNVNDYVIFEGWYDGIFNYSIKVTSPTGEILGPINSGHESGRDTKDGAIVIDNAKGGPKTNLNGDKQFLIQIFDNTSSQPPKAGIWKINVYGATGRFDMWLAGSTMDASISSNIDNSMIVGTPGTAFNAITVGAYITKKRWVDLDGNSLQNPNLIVYSASSFSSSGPARDGRTKPEISAPGELIAASYSADAPPNGQHSIFKSSYSQWPNAYIVRDGKHAITQGTSFAAPHVAGTVALMLQQYPNKTPGEIRQAIISTARTDNFTGTVPNDKWGYGKLDVLAGLQLLSVNDPVSESKVSKSLELHQNYPNPFNPTTVIPYSIPDIAEVQLSVYNLLGQKIRTLIDNVQDPGSYKVTWNGKDDSGKMVSSGIYFYRLAAGIFSQTRKLILLP